MDIILNLGLGPAYIDPGTGSMVFQAVIAGALGAAYTVKLSWARIKAFFQSKFGTKKKK